MASKTRVSFPFSVLALILLTIASGWAQAANFEQGTTRVSISAGGSSGFNGNYFQLGLGVGYYLYDGLELGLDGRSWLGGQYNIHELSPSLTYVVTQLGGFRPYAGVMYRRTFIGGLDDLSALGARGGIFLDYSRNLMLRAGVVAIRHQNCSPSAYYDCTEIYPEISAGLYF